MTPYNINTYNIHSDEITDIGDQIEGAQDNLRTTTSTTKSSISSIQSDAIQREIQLKNELSDLEDRLAALRKDAELVAKERDMLTKSINTESRALRKQSNQELNSIKAELIKDKKAITRTERYELDARLQTAQLQKDPSAAALQEEKSITPPIPSLKDMLTSLAAKFKPDIDDLKEQRNANEMFFDTSFKQLRLDKKEELKIAKGVYETEVKEEDTALDNAVTSYKQQLVDSEKELQRSIDQLNEPIESFGTDAINQELLNQQAIQQESAAAITQQQLDYEAALQDSADSITAIQDSYDAKLEDTKRNLIKTKYRTSSQLKQADKKKRSRRIQLVYEREELTRSLSQLMVDERDAAKAEYQALKKDKSDILASNLQQVASTNEEIATTRSKLIYVQQELNMLENTSKKNHIKIDKLREERGSFRKQLKRTVKVAVNKLPLVNVE